MGVEKAKALRREERIEVSKSSPRQPNAFGKDPGGGNMGEAERDESERNSGEIAENAKNGGLVTFVAKKDGE